MPTALSGFRVLVTGANGLVGRALCAELISQGCQVKAAVRHPDQCEALAGVVFVASPDLEDRRADWLALLEDIDVVVHTAARVHVMNPAPDEAERFLAINTEGTSRLAAACEAVGVRRFIYLSTIKVNGETTPKGEAFRAVDPVAPTDPYAVSKLQAERVLSGFADRRALEVVVIRPPLVYGPGAKGNLELLERLIRRQLPLPFGLLDGNRRSLVSLGNLVSLIMTCISHPTAANQTLMVSDGDDVSTLRLTRLIGEACGVAVRVVPVPISLLRLMAGLLGKREMLRRLTDNLQVDISMTRKRLDWQPPESVAEGMRAAFGKPRV